MPEQKPRRKTDRTITPLGHIIQAKRMSKGWSGEELAARAHCSTRTISSVEASSKVYPSTLLRIARALGEDYESLKQKDEAGIQLITLPNISNVKILFEGSLESYDETVFYIDVINALIEKAQLKGIVELKDIIKSSILMNFDFHEIEDVERLVVAFCTGQLSTLGIQGFSVPQNVDVPEIIVGLAGSDSLTTKYAVESISAKVNSEPHLIIMKEEQNHMRFLLTKHGWETWSFSVPNRDDIHPTIDMASLTRTRAAEPQLDREDDDPYNLFGGRGWKPED
ncbi:helix-turn-helix domain-containing protein [Tundrisphaera sp. TA3]|uniref:helix-turn-helix domain-containing protein n=1 Tax=Tundrisphaera sp. TA3 TaxID=3435775 RepID=UPI003EBFB9C7